jgi:hypothetical protein
LLISSQCSAETFNHLRTVSTLTSITSATDPEIHAF